MSLLSWTVQSAQIRAGAQCSGPKYPQNEPQNELSSVPFSLLLSLSLQSCAQVTILQTRITVTTIKSIAWAHNLPVLVLKRAVFQMAQEPPARSLVCREVR